MKRTERDEDEVKEEEGNKLQRSDAQNIRELVDQCENEENTEQRKPKNVIFCLGEHGFVNRMVAWENSKLCQAIEMQQILFCAFKCSAHSMEAFDLPLKVSVADIRFFVECILNEDYIHKCCNDIRMGNDVLFRTEINFENLQLLTNWMQTPVSWLDSWKNFFIPNARFVYPSTALTAHRICPKKSKLSVFPCLDFEGCLLNQDFSKSERLEYVMLNADKEAKFVLMPGEYMDSVQVSEMLGIEACFMELLDKDICVLAGGAALKLGCPLSTFSARENVKFFALSCYKMVLKKFTACCHKTGRILYKKKEDEKCSVIYGIGYADKRQVQLIFTKEKTAHSLISCFSIFATQAYFDGSLLCATAMAHYDWDKLLTTPNPHRPVTSKRLLAISKRGFSLNSQQQDHINKVFSPKDVIEFEWNYPFLLQESVVSKQQQELWMKAFGLILFDQTNWVADIDRNLDHFSVYVDADYEETLRIRSGTWLTGQCLEVQIIAQELCELISVDLTYFDTPNSSRLKRSKIPDMVNKVENHVIHLINEHKSIRFGEQKISDMELSSSRAFFMNKQISLYLDGTPMDIKKYKSVSNCTVLVRPKRAVFEYNPEKKNKLEAVFEWEFCVISGRSANANAT